MRRGVCALTTKDYNRLFLQALLAARQADPANAGDAVVNFLADQTADSRLWPHDGVFIATLTVEGIYNSMHRARLKTFLVGLETFSRTSKTDRTAAPVKCADKKINIEHVMPQSWEQNWALPLDATEQQKFARIEALHRLGNLTLASSSLNSALSHHPWQVKKHDLKVHSLMRLTTGSLQRHRRRPRNGLTTVGLKPGTRIGPRLWGLPRAPGS